MSDSKISTDHPALEKLAELDRKELQAENPVLPINKNPFANPVDTLRRMRQFSPCFTKAFDRGQRVFVLVEQDATAYRAIAQWIHANRDRLGDNHPKIIAAKTTLSLFMNSNQHQKDPD